MDEIEYLKTILTPLTTYPEHIKIEHRIDEMGVLLTLRVDAADMGKIVGRQGGTANAIRTILRTFGGEKKARINLKIEEPTQGKRKEREFTQFDPPETNWSSTN